MHARNSTGLVNILVILSTFVLFAESEVINETTRMGTLFDIVDFNGVGMVSTDDFAILVLTAMTSIGSATGESSVRPYIS